MRKVAKANLIATSAISYLDIDSIVSAWKKATALNNRVAMS